MADGVGSKQVLQAKPEPGPKAEAAAITQDFLWRGRLSFWQPAKRHGYRFNLDPVLLAGAAPAYPDGHVMDFGAGCGIVGILMLAQNKAARITAVEVQPQLAQLIGRNAAANGFADRINVISGDLRHAALPCVDAVMFNPPYYPVKHFRPCAHPGRDQGRREQNGTLADFVASAAAALDATDKTTARAASLSAIVPVQRFAEICGYIRDAGAYVASAREVWPKASGPAAHVLVTARLQGPHRPQHHAAPASAPLILHTIDGRNYTPTITAWVEGPAL